MRCFPLKGKHHMVVVVAVAMAMAVQLTHVCVCGITAVPPPLPSTNPVTNQLGHVRASDDEEEMCAAKIIVSHIRH